jgi:hypothetical protein
MTIIDLQVSLLGLQAASKGYKTPLNRGLGCYKRDKIHQTEGGRNTIPHSDGYKYDAKHYPPQSKERLQGVFFSLRPLSGPRCDYYWQVMAHIHW